MNNTVGSSILLMYNNAVSASFFFSRTTSDAVMTWNIYMYNNKSTVEILYLAYSYLHYFEWNQKCSDCDRNGCQCLLQESFVLLMFFESRYPGECFQNPWRRNETAVFRMVTGEAFETLSCWRISMKSQVYPLYLYTTCNLQITSETVKPFNYALR